MLRNNFIHLPSLSLVLNPIQFECIYCPIEITRKDGFCFAFYNENILFWLTISYQIPFVCLVSVFCSQVCTLKLNLRPNISLTYCKVINFEILSEKISFAFLYWIWIIEVSQQYSKIFRQNEQAQLVQNLPASDLPYRFLHNLLSVLLHEKVKVCDFLKK